MHPSSHPQIAVIADAHFHDIEGHYGVDGLRAGAWTLTMRPLEQSARSTRVFNESASALRAALDDVVARGIRHVVLLGDYSDDGQITTLAGLRRLLDQYRDRDGLRFYATPGNHDIFGADGRHRAKRFLNVQGGHDLVTSDPEREKGEEDDAVVVWLGMRCLGYPDGLKALPDLGFFGAPDAKLWETPFGTNPNPPTRRYRVTSPDSLSSFELMDGSYLVEPFEGVWLLMIDANVFEPLDVKGPEGEDFADSTDAGWNGMLRYKGFILQWMSDVARRAREQGKVLLAFSHYPVLDPLDGTGEDERALLGETSMLRRVPGLDVADAMMEAGIRIHFSGHLHINDTARHVRGRDFLVNASMPSLVAFPAAYKIVTVARQTIEVTTVSLDDLRLDAGVMEQYGREAARAGFDSGGMLDAKDYGSFLHAHIGHLTGRRYLKREWPEGMANVMRSSSLEDLARIAAGGNDLPDARHLLSGISAMDFLPDWYRVRMGSGLGLDAIDDSKRVAYDLVADMFRALERADAEQMPFKRLFRMYEQHTSGLPSRDFTIDLDTGRIEGH